MTVKYFDIEIIKTASKTLVDQGETYTYTITFRNLTGSKLTNVVLTDPISDTRINYVVGSCTGGCGYNSTNRTLSWQRAELNANQSESVQFNVKVNTTINAFSPVVNTATIDTNETNPKSSSATVNIRNIIVDLGNTLRTGGSGIVVILSLTVIGLIGGGVFLLNRRRSKLNIDIISSDQNTKNQ